MTKLFALGVILGIILGLLLSPLAPGLHDALLKGYDTYLHRDQCPKGFICSKLP